MKKDVQKTAIVVPCYNEAQRLRIQEYLAYANENENVYFFFVNDGSTDGTRQLLDTLCHKNPAQMLCIQQPKNCGKAAAVRQGFLKAMAMGFDYIGYWDADLSTPLRPISTFCEILEDPHITLVMGSRIKILGRQIDRLAVRHYLGRVFATAASILLQIPVYDTQCGAKIFRNNLELKKAFSIPFSVKWTFDVELLARYKIIKDYLNRLPVEASTIEYPLKKWIHVSGSKIEFKDYFLVGMELFILFLSLYAPLIARKYARQFE
ncbi:glycosyltransferase [Thermodesulfobacteriota bacterium]